MVASPAAVYDADGRCSPFSRLLLRKATQPLCLYDLAHRNRSDFCDLRLRCPSRTPEIARFPRQETAMMHCDSRVRWKVASDLRFRAAISEPKTPSFCGISGDLAQSTRKSLAIAIVRFWCAKLYDIGMLGHDSPSTWRLASEKRSKRLGRRELTTMYENDHPSPNGPILCKKNGNERLQR